MRMASRSAIVVSGGVTLPPKNAVASPANVQALSSGLTWYIAGHPQAIQPWTFYEVLDTYLGPWGRGGYPIAYGKFYCFAFNSNEKLSSNAATRNWVMRTTVKLQEALRDYVVARFKAGTLAGITESELREAAFDSHPMAYTDGGLATVALVAPELIKVISLIPRKEFSPASVNFMPSLRQLLSTMDLVAPRVAGLGLAAMAGPAHTGLFARAAQQDMREMLNEQAMAARLLDVQSQIQRGELDDIRTLNTITDRLNATEYPDQSMAALARKVVQSADDRKHYVARTYRSLLMQRPDLRSKLDRSAPGWMNW
jgi:hypothetical protein